MPMAKRPDLVQAVFMAELMEVIHLGLAGIRLEPEVSKGGVPILIFLPFLVRIFSPNLEVGRVVLELARVVLAKAMI